MLGFRSKTHFFSALFFVAVLAAATFPKSAKLDSPDFKVFYTAAQHALHDPEYMYKRSPDRFLYPPATSILLNHRRGIAKQV